MKSTRNSLILLTFMIVTLSACGGAPQRKPKVRSVPEGSIQTALGELNKKRFEKCDLEQFAQRVEIAKALDKRKDHIIEISKTLPRPDYKRVPVGDHTFLIRNTKPEEPKDEWNTHEFGWDFLIKLYEKIKDKDTDERWMYLDSMARGILAEDINRINRRANYYLGRKAKTAIKELYEDLKACFMDSQCVEPKYRPQAKELYLTNPQYQKYHDPGNYTPRQNLVLFYKWVAFDYKNDFETVKLETVSRIDETTFDVKVFAGVFEKGKETIKKWFEETWNTHGYQATITWVESSHPSNPFEILYSPNPGGRDYVSFTRRHMKLYGEPRKTTLLHEMGHLFGLADYYYTTWNPDTCEYTEEYNSGDIMSSSSTGLVTMQSWRDLDETYPHSKSATP